MSFVAKCHAYIFATYTALCGSYDGETVCIGKPAANVRAYVVNKHGNHCPINCIGELWIAGANVCAGYLNRQAENNIHFGLDPFVNDDGSRSRVYKTGDLCRRLPDGRIQFIGRRDKQIKLNGYRIEIGDIQKAMPRAVQSSHIIVENGQLIGFVMPKVDVSEIRAYMQGKLPTVSNFEIDSFVRSSRAKVPILTLVSLYPPLLAYYST